MRRLLTGYHAIRERLAAGAAGTTLIVSRGDRRTAELIALARSVKAEIRECAEEELTRLCGRGDHRGAALELDAVGPEAERLDAFLERLEAPQALVLVLDGITDPHNLGAILRSADQFQADLVILPNRRSARETETVARTSAGANVYVPVALVPNVTRALDALKQKGFWIYGADANGSPLAKTALTGRTALVLGSEGEGIHRLVAEHCDAMIAIPTRGHIASLNVSVAAGILLYEARRQQWRSDEGSKPD